MFAKVDSTRETEIEIKRFARSYRRRLRKLVVGNPRLADLLYSFPAVAFALVSDFGDADCRGRAVALAKKGAPLKDIANELGMPMWMRKLPPEAFYRPLGVLPDEERFARQVGQLMPRNVDACAAWLQWTLSGYRGCNSRFALWLAARLSFLNRSAHDCVPVAPLAAYAWFSLHSSNDLGRALIKRPWQPSMGFGKAVEETEAWINRISSEVRLPPRRRGPGRYSRSNALKGYYVVVLRTGAQLRAEGQAMDHCVGSYDRRVANGECIIVSIRRGQRRLATMELVRPKCGWHVPYGIAQLQGPSNTRPAPSVARVAKEWVSKHAFSPLTTGASVAETAVDLKAWDHLWGPYLARNDGSCASHLQLNLDGLVCDVEQLANIV